MRLQKKTQSGVHRLLSLLGLPVLPLSEKAFSFAIPFGRHCSEQEVFGRFFTPGTVYHDC